MKVFDMGKNVSRFFETTHVADALLAYQDGRTVEVQCGPPEKRAWTEAAPIQIEEGRSMRIELRSHHEP